MTQPGTFNDLSVALRMREVIAQVVREEMFRQRPPARYARVVNFNRFTMSANVLFPGDVETTAVKFPLNLQPIRSTDLGYGNNADIVRIEGVPGNLWITEVVNGRVQEDSTRINSLSLMGGQFIHEVRARHFSAGTSPLPGQNESWYVGRWKNPDSFGADGLAHMEIVVQQTILAAVIKHYSVSIRSNDTSGAWRRVAPEQDSGPWAGNDFELELKTTGDGVEFRVRRTAWNTGFTPGGYDIDIWFYGKEWERDYSLNEAILPDGPPPRFVGTTSSEGKGPFHSPAMHIPHLAQRLLTGGGAVHYINSGGLTLLKWTQRFLIVGLGRNHLAPAGYFDIPVPVGGVAVPIYGKSGGVFSTVTVAGGIWLTDWDALYYEIPWGSDNTGLEANFRIVHFTDTDVRFQVPSHWVLVAVRLAESNGFQYVQMGNGDIIDWPHPPTLGSGWANLGSGWTEAGARAMDMGRVALEGMLANAAAKAVGANIITLPNHFKPISSRYFTCTTSTGFARVEVLTSGAVNLQTAMAAGGWISLDGINFPRSS